MKDYYAILQVSPRAEQVVIEAAYRRLARKYHPDVYSGPDAASRMREMNEAYEVLGDPRRRAEYDAERRFARARAETKRPQGDRTPPPRPPPSPPAGGSEKAQGPTAEAAPRRHRTDPAWPVLAAGAVLAVAIAGGLAVAGVILAGQGQREGAQLAAPGVTPITAVATVTPITAMATLNVVGVETTYGVVPPPTSNPPKSSIEVSLPSGYSDRLAAYDGGGIIVVAPLGWTGTGSVGANGNRSIDLQPVSTASEGRISVYIASESTGSAVWGAAPFFPWVRSHWQELGGPFPAPTPPLGINTTFVTNSLIKYTLPTTSGGLEINGVAFSNAQDHLKFGVGFEIIGVGFEEMEVALPTAQHDLAMVILDTFVSQQRLK